MSTQTSDNEIRIEGGLYFRMLVLMVVSLFMG